MGTCTATWQPYSNHPDRFDVWPQNTCVDAVTGRWSGAGLVVWEYQCHIKPSAGRDGVMKVNVDVTISPGDCSALSLDIYLVTITII